MLSLLNIDNIAVIEHAEIRFDSGFNALTGETGAGKSIVIDAIGAVLGERTSRDLIRTGAKSARVEAVFSGLPQLPWFSENGIEPDENGDLLLQRELQADGKNICRAGGRLLTVSQLKTLGQQLLNIHGQHDGQQLLDEKCHLAYLDRFGGTEAELEDYRNTYRQLCALRREIAELQMDDAEKARRVDSLNYQIKELERAQLKRGEDEELKTRRDLLRNATKLIDAVECAHAAFFGDEERLGICAQIGDAERALAGAAAASEEIAALREKTLQLRYAADDLAEQVRDLRGEFDFSPEDLDELEGRLDVLYRLKKKYGSTTDEMLDYLERCRQELDQIQDSADTIARLEKRLEIIRKEADGKAGRLSEKRHAAAEILQERIREELAQLDMPRVRFYVAFEDKLGQDGLDENGMDEVRFLMSANVGEDLKPIAKIASGGELARIMLALKGVLAENDDVSTLIFDEVDTGVSGRAARKVAEKMAVIARTKQVLCVTHLPQIAAMADVHFSVEKEVRDGRTYTEVERLEHDGRKMELARLSGGGDVTGAQLESAEELLREGERFRTQCRGG